MDACSMDWRKAILTVKYTVIAYIKPTHSLA